MNVKIRKKSLIHENADANITCDFVDGDISRSSSRLPHTRTDGHIVSSIIVRFYNTAGFNVMMPIFDFVLCFVSTHR